MALSSERKDLGDEDLLGDKDLGYIVDETKIVPFNKANRERWGDVVKRIPAEIERLDGEAAPYQTILDGNYPRYNTLRRERSDLLMQRNISVVETVICDGARNHAQTAGEAAFAGTVEGFWIANAVSSHTAYNETNGEFDRLRGIISHNEIQIEPIRTRQKILSGRLETLQGLIKDYDICVGRLRKNPEQQFSWLLKKIEATVKKFHEEHPHHQHVNSRIVFHNISKKLQYIKNSNVIPKDIEIPVGKEKTQKEGEEKESGSLANEQWRIRYAYLCGFLWNAYEQVPGVSSLLPLRCQLSDVLRETHIPQGGTLPEYDQYRCSHYTHLFNSNRDTLRFYEVTEFSDKNGIEDQDYEKACKLVMSDNSLPILQEIQAAIIRQATILKNKDRAETHFYTRVLNETADLYKNKEGGNFLDLLKSYRELIKITPGAHSESQEMVGYMLIFIGIGMAMVALVAFASGAGTVALAATQLGGYLTTQTLGVCGTLTTALGISFICKSGLARQMDKYADEAEKKWAPSARAAEKANIELLKEKSKQGTSSSKGQSMICQLH